MEGKKKGERMGGKGLINGGEEDGERKGRKKDGGMRGREGRYEEGARGRQEGNEQGSISVENE